MTTLNLFSWNSQGNYTEPGKEKVIKTTFGASQEPTVVFIQEGGVEKTAPFDTWAVYPGKGVGAKNERCTNYVLVNTAARALAPGQSILLADGENRAVVGGGEAGRTPAAVELGKLLLISWHSLSGKSNEDTATLIQALESNKAYTSAFETVVIGGDFNTDPNSLHGTVVSGLTNVRAKPTFVHRYVVGCGKDTFKSGGELDFFIVLAKNEHVSLGCSTDAVGPSDHNPIAMSLKM